MYHLNISAFHYSGKFFVFSVFQEKAKDDIPS